MEAFNMDINVNRNVTPPAARISPPQQTHQRTPARSERGEVQRPANETPRTEPASQASVYVQHTRRTGNDEYAMREERATVRMLQSAIAEANRRLSTAHRQIQSSIHEQTNRLMVRVIDTYTNEVIREIPPERVLDAHAALLELAGLFVDTQG
jgi:flagellar protein FlaG